MGFFSWWLLCVLLKKKIKNQNKNLGLLQIAQGSANSTNDFSDIWNEIRENKEVCLQKTPRAQRVFSFFTNKKKSQNYVRAPGPQKYVIVFLKVIILLRIEPLNKHWILPEKKEFLNSYLFFSSEYF